MSRPRSIKTSRAAAGSAGYTLAEVLVATLLASVMVTAVFSASLTARRAAGHNDRRLLANQIARTVTSRLANFVSACCNSSNCGVTTSCGSLSGPNTARTGLQTWNFYTSPNTIDSRGDVYALQAGAHTITGTDLIPAWFGSAPYNARIIYTVAWTGSVPQVDVQVDWTEPTQ